MRRLSNALKIVSAAEVYGVECMLGCMLEAKVSVTAAVHLACANAPLRALTLTARRCAARTRSPEALCSMAGTSP